MKKIILGCLLAFGLQSAKAQLLTGVAAEKVHPSAAEVRYDQRSSAPLYIGFKPGTFVAASSGMEAMRSVLQLRNSDTWQLIRSDRDELGMVHHRYQQYYNNVKVITGEYILHEKQGSLAAANGMFFSNLAISTSPTLTEKAALTSALNTIGAGKYLWQASEAEQRALTGNLAYPKGELVILPKMGYDKTQSTALCWMFDVYSVQPHERWLVYVDAQTGKVLFKENKICTITTNGTAVTKYSGTKTIKVDSLSATSYRLREYSRGGGVETYNLLNGTNYATAVDFTDTDNLWNVTANQDNAAYDAHYGAEMTWDYYWNTHSRNSYNGLGSTLKSYVHYSSGYNNAFWNGSVMTYGDGDGSTFSALTEMDICAHELTHGVTSTSSNLTYSYESGALNESFSDIFGVTVDFFARPAQANWIMADQSYTPASPGDGIRYMNNPNLASNPDTYLGTYWYTGAGDNGGVHYNSGVQNFWYYLLCQGGSGTNDNGFAYNVASITMNKARMIAFRNNTFYLTSGSQYADAAFYALKSANDIYGNCSPEAVAVKNAWDAVGVMGLVINANATAALTSGACAGSTLQLLASGGTTYSWSGPGGFTSSIANPVIPNASASNNGIYTCVVTDANGCSGTPKVTVSVNAAPSVTASGGGAICNGSSRQLSAAASVPGQGGNNGVNTTPLAIPDAPAAGVTSSITISGSSTAAAIISVTIDSLIHTYDADLKIELIAPNGSVITLASGVGGSGDNFIRTRFVTGATAIASGAAPFTGNFAPQQAFAGLTGTANGTWTLRITDLGAVDVGTLYKWSISFPGNSISSYSWSPATGLNNAAVFNPVASPAATTTYTVTVTDNNGCTAQSNTTVTIGTLSTTVNSNNVLCFGNANGTASVSVNGATGTPVYAWSNGAATSSISGLQAGTYTYTVTDGSGCSATGSVVITAPAQITGYTTSQNASCGLNDGSAYLNFSGGVGPYTYLWSNGAATPNISGLAPGNYSVTVTDANGCTFNSSTSVSGSNLNTTPSSTNATCFGTANGTASLQTTGANGTPTYSWSNGASSSSISGLAAGTYTYTVTDGLGCTASGNVVITTPAQISGNATATDAGCGASNGAVNLSVSGGVAPYSYQWSNGATTQNISSLAAGTYTVTITDANGCVKTAGATVGTTAGNAPSTPTSLSGTKTGVCPGITRTFSCPLVAGATSYNWTVPANTTISSGQGTNSISLLINAGFTSGSIQVTASNSCGTSNAKSATLRSIPLAPGSITGPVNNLCGTTTSYSIAASTTGATSYTWTVPAGATILSGQGTTGISVAWPSTLISGASITVTANNACGSSAAKALTAITTIPLKPATITGPTTVCANQTGLSYSVTTQPGVTYNWSGPAGVSILSGQGTGAVTVKWGTVTGSIKVIASNSCGSAVAKTSKVTVGCREGDFGSIEASLVPNPGNGQAVINFNNDPGNYVVTVNNILGQLLYTERSSDNQYELKMQGKTAGLYLVSVQFESGEKKVLRMIIQ